MVAAKRAVTRQREHLIPFSYLGEAHVRAAGRLGRYENGARKVRE